MPVRIVSIGYTSHPVQSPRYRSTGRYRVDELPRLILENDVDIVCIPSIGPETFSYTTQEAMAMGLPLACFDIGAPAERVARYEKGIIIPEIDAAVALERLMGYAQAKGILREDMKTTPPVLFIVERKDDAARYRVDHFREELWFHGIGSQLVMSGEAANVDVALYSSIVLYRCADTKVMEHVKKEASRFDIKVFFDMDDLAFDFNAVRSSALPQEEKQQYFRLSYTYSKNMQLADGLLASTEALAAQMRRMFPGKPVCVHRNAASMEMELLGLRAGNNKTVNEDGSVSLAWFSGSFTHDADFKLIAKPLCRIFERYPNVKLRVYGCLRLPKEVKGWKNRIEEFGLAEDGRALPEAITKADIVLAPLVDNAFTRCKSENKWIEAAIAGVPTVASRLPELELIIRDGETGYLCETQEEWEEALTALIERPELRSQIGKQAQRQALATHLIRNRNDDALRFILSRD